MRGERVREVVLPSLGPLRLAPELHPRVWGGQRLRAGEPPIGEAWIVHEQNRVLDGPAAGRSLAEVAAAYGPDMLGRRVVQQTGRRFPLLIKLLDTADWLSLQVHPNDEQAAALEGPGQVGKTEAWHFLEAAPDARVICGLRPGVGRAALAAAIQDGTILDLVAYVPVRAGDTLFMPAGTIHALGPGLLLYEVQQASDITYRVFDWNRPQTAGRTLHIEQSLAVADPQASSRVTPAPAAGDDASATLATCEYFTLERISALSRAVQLDTLGESFHALTVVEGEARVEGDGWSVILARLETAVIPAACRAYAIQPRGPARILKASGGQD
jgi:mannose-6-phosphate isomerase